MKHLKEYKNVFDIGKAIYKRIKKLPDTINLP